jgi:SAM-dependent methyltransferase
MDASREVIWHDIECGAYTADLPVWRALAAQAAGPVLDVGAGTGRVALDLARHGHEVTALDRDPALLSALRERASALSVTTVEADARGFSLPFRFALCVVPMQTIQLLGGRRGRAGFLRRARDHLLPGGLLAAAITLELESFDGAGGARLPAPDMREVDGWVYSSQPVGIHRDGEGTVLSRTREAVAPDGRRTVEQNAVRLDTLTVAQLEAEVRVAGLAPLGHRTVPPTSDHAGSEVVIARA